MFKRKINEWNYPLDRIRRVLRTRSQGQQKRYVCGEHGETKFQHAHRQTNSNVDKDRHDENKRSGESWPNQCRVGNLPEERTERERVDQQGSVRYCELATLPQIAVPSHQLPPSSFPVPAKP